ncbi:cupin [Alsobacter soli]|uniref:Cupin n=1 Tax=Alsobacter soli TaxID=2109933 RepID=A0A2T1HVT4_9HYPH|nr:cupin domain-containing protein [Alsobacter soli]PSC05720.1 cupin [Alsobacter soli]
MAAIPQNAARIPAEAQHASAAPTCRKVQPGAEFTGKQALAYKPGISAESVGSKHLHMQMLTIPPGGRAKAHKHESHETAIYVLSGHSAMWYGPELEHHMEVGAGEYCYIPADVPHLPYNTSQTEPCVAIIARTDPNEQESVVLMPELDRLRS